MNYTGQYSHIYFTNCDLTIHGTGSANIVSDTDHCLAVFTIFNLCPFSFFLFF